MVKQYALQIERILRTINPQRTYGCDDIELNPYAAITQELNGKVSNALLQRFTTYYSAIDGQTLAYLINSSFDIKQFINDLEMIKNEYFKEID